jgi:hypothetical protein
MPQYWSITPILQVFPFQRCRQALTSDERKALILVSSLFLLGLAAEGWRAWTKHSP